MIKKLLNCIILAVSVTLLAACSTTQPILNINNQSVPGTLTAAQVKNSIVIAGAARGWSVSETNPGVLTASISPREHHAQVTIPYSATSYSIIYQSSSNLDAGPDNTIHRNYNKWVTLLNRQIQKQLVLTGKQTN